MYIYINVYIHIHSIYTFAIANVRAVMSDGDGNAGLRSTSEIQEMWLCAFLVWLKGLRHVISRVYVNGWRGGF